MNASSCIDRLWQEGYFKDGRNLGEVSIRIRDKWEHNFSSVDISKSLTKALYLRRTGKRGKYKYVQKTSPVSKRVATIEDELFSSRFLARLGQKFEVEVEDLRLNFGHSGTCTSFLLRKMLEKMIYIVFAKNNLLSKIEDKTKPGRLVGLESMINIASQEKINGTPILTPQTATKINGIKFLGDTSAHNPLTTVDMETIVPQMPFIITAYNELLENM